MELLTYRRSLAAEERFPLETGPLSLCNVDLQEAALGTPAVAVLFHQVHTIGYSCDRDHGHHMAA